MATHREIKETEEANTTQEHHEVFEMRPSSNSHRMESSIDRDENMVEVSNVDAQEVHTGETMTGREEAVSAR